MFPSLTNIVLMAFIACLPVCCYQLQPLLRHALYPVSQISRVRFLSITHFVRFRAWIVIGELWLRLLVLHTSDVIPCFQCFRRGFVILCEDYATLTSSRCYLAPGANDENRTRIASLEGWSSTIEPHPHFGGPCWTRTSNLSVNSRLHYHCANGPLFRRLYYASH